MTTSTIFTVKINENIRLDFECMTSGNLRIIDNQTTLAFYIENNKIDLGINSIDKKIINKIVKTLKLDGVVEVNERQENRNKNLKLVEKLESYINFETLEVSRLEKSYAKNLKNDIVKIMNRDDF